MDERELQPAGDASASAILLIDDNAVQAATRQTILKRAGYYVIAVLSPVRALQQIQNHEFPADIKLVITDHLMPGMMGAEFVRKGLCFRLTRGGEDAAVRGPCH